MPISWHPDFVMIWCMPGDEKVMEVTDSCFEKLSDMLKLKMY